MTIVTGIIVFTVLWWLVFVMVMAKRDGVERSLSKRFLITTIIAAILWGAVEAIIVFDLVSLKEG